MTAAVRYSGLDPDGRWVIARPTTTDVAALVPRLFQAGWRRLTVVDPTGHLVGSIGPKSEHDTRLGWWVE